MQLRPRAHCAEEKHAQRRVDSQGRRPGDEQCLSAVKAVATGEAHHHEPLLTVLVLATVSAMVLTTR